MMGKPKPKKHTTKEIAAKVDAATMNRGVGNAGLADRSGIKNGGHARFECPLCKVIAPDIKLMQIHRRDCHPKIPFDEAKITDLHDSIASTVANSSKPRPGARGSLKKCRFSIMIKRTMVVLLALVNDTVLAGNTLVSCSSDTTLKTWNCLSEGTYTRTLRQHSDYVICLATAKKHVFIWDIDATLSPIAKSIESGKDESSNGILGSENLGVPLTSLRSTNSNNNLYVHNSQSHGYSHVAGKGHKESVYALAMNDSETLLVFGGTEKVLHVWDLRTHSNNMKLRAHTDNIRALLLDPIGRGRKWNLLRQRLDSYEYSVE